MTIDEILKLFEPYSLILVHTQFALCNAKSGKELYKQNFENAKRFSCYYCDYYNVGKILNALNYLEKILDDYYTEAIKNGKNRTLYSQVFR